jgi:integrase
VEATDSLLVFPGADGGLRKEESKPNGPLRTALKRAGIVVGYRHTCRRCGFVQERESGDVKRCPTCGYKLWPVALPRPITIHSLRHTTGTLLAKNGISLRIIQEVLRHADIDVTAEHYTHVDLTDSRRAIDATLSDLPGRPDAFEPARYREAPSGPG